MPVTYESSPPATMGSARLRQLEERFASLEERIEDSPFKQALSVLHGLIQETQRSALAPGDAGTPGPRPLSEIQQLYRKAPPMEAPALSTPLPVGTAAPDFTLPDGNGRPVSLSDHRGRMVVLAFYPLDWSPGCSQQLDLYENEADELRRREVQLLAISVDSAYSHGAWAAVRGIGFPLLSDFNPKGAVAQRYGVYREPDGFAERALYVIGKSGVIRHAHVSPYLHHVPDVYELFQALDAAAEAERGER